MVKPTAGTVPLAGVRVIDLTHMLSGPYCTWMLAAMGADVIKVERPGTGDFAREIAPFTEEGSLYFQSINRGKRSIALDLKTEEGKQLLLDLAADADILVENNRPGVMSRLGLGYDVMSRLNPKLVYASISGFGQTGPHADRPAFDTIIQAMSGLMSITGEPEGPPTRVGASVSDISAGLYATVGILAALHQTKSTSIGCHLDVSMLDAQLAMLENAAARHLTLGDEPFRVGNRHPLMTPFQSFETADRVIVVCCDTNAQWRRLCGVLECVELIDDPRFLNGNARTEHYAQLEPILASRFRTRSAAQWLEDLHKADVPAGPVNTISDCLADAHVEARSMIARTGKAHFVALPLFGGGLSQLDAPELDEHREGILIEIEERRQARRSGAALQSD